MMKNYELTQNVEKNVRGRNQEYEKKQLAQVSLPPYNSDD